MKLTTSLILTTILLLSSNQAQEKQDSTDYLNAGLWSIQFGIAENFTLRSFNGSTFSGKYQFTDKSALRLGITMNGNTGLFS